MLAESGYCNLANASGPRMCSGDSIEPPWDTALGESGYCNSATTVVEVDGTESVREGSTEVLGFLCGGSSQSVSAPEGETGTVFVGVIRGRRPRRWPFLDGVMAFFRPVLVPLRSMRSRSLSALSPVHISPLGEVRRPRASCFDC